MSFKVPYQFRMKQGPFRSSDADGNNGAFEIPYESYLLYVIASDGEGWEHVSVSMRSRCPNWDMMCFIKDLFWDLDDCVVQYHPPNKDYVNNCGHCLHLWRPIGIEFPRPPSILVGLK